MIAHVWVAPLEWFNFKLVRHGLPLCAHVAIPLLCISVMCLPDGHIRSRRFERSGRVYELLGVRFLRQFMRQGDHQNRALRRDYPARCANVNRDDAQTRAAERGHLLNLIVGTFTTPYYLCLASTGSPFTTSNNLPMFLMLKRYTPARIEGTRCR